MEQRSESPAFMNREAKRKIKILIADTDSDFRDVAHRELSREGFRVESIADLDEVIEHFKGDRFQIVFLDDAGFQDSGTDLLESIRRIDDDVVVIGMTSVPSLDGALTAIRQRLFDYREKSLLKDELLDVVNLAIKQKGLVVDFERKINLEIGKKIRQLRKERGLTLKQLANRTGLSISLISQIERAKSSSSVSTLYKIATALSVKLEYFFSGL